MAQANNKQQIAVFTPVYLDTAFDGNNYKLFGNYLPKNMLPGLEFYNGIMMAIDSLKKTQHNNLIVNIYDYKSKGNSINEIIHRNANNLDSSTVIIASFNNRNDLKSLADYALQHSIPLISATYPNDGGITANPYFFLINSTLKTHCKALYNFLQKNDTAQLVYVTRKGNVEETVNNYFKCFDSNYKSTALQLPPKYLVDTFYSFQLIKLLDSNKQNVIFCGTMSDAFALKIANTVAAQKKYRTTLVGLPNWDALNAFDKKEYSNIEFIYSSPYNYCNSTLISGLTQRYKNKYTAKPNDLVFKGYEIMLRIANAVSAYGKNGMQFFGDDMFNVVSKLDIQPIIDKQDSNLINYYENKKIYIIKKIAGIDKIAY